MDEIAFHTRLHSPGTILDVGAHDGLIALRCRACRAAPGRLRAPAPAFARLRADLRGGA
jgi:hypothetical protein